MARQEMAARGISREGVARRMKKRSSPRDESPRRRERRQAGFSLVELMIVVTIVLITSAIAVTNYIRQRHVSLLRGACTDFAGLIQTERIRAVQDGKFYSLVVSSTQAFVDLKGTGNFAAGDPSVTFPMEVSAIAASSAPATSKLYGHFLPSGSSIGASANTAYDGYPGGTASLAITFNARGLPCKTQGITGEAGVTVCDSAGGAIPYWVFFKNTFSGEQEAVTVNPSGRIRKWYYGGGDWNGL